MKCGEIWFVDFGNTAIGHEYKKNRPVLVIQCDEQIRVANVITIIPFTSQDKSHKDDILVPKDKTNNLYFDSVVKVHHIQSFDKTRFIKKLGILEKETMEKIKDYLKRHFEI